jgi:hypothetical protein
MRPFVSMDEHAHTRLLVWAAHATHSRLNNGYLQCDGVASVEHTMDLSKPPRTRAPHSPAFAAGSRYRIACQTFRSTPLPSMYIRPSRNKQKNIKQLHSAAPTLLAYFISPHCSLLYIATPYIATFTTYPSRARRRTVRSEQP